MKDLLSLYEETSLSTDTICVILGSLLGNMKICIDNISGKAFIKFKHYYKNLEYFLWKKNLLKELDTSLLIMKNDKFCCYVSKPDLRLNNIVNIVRRKNRKVTRKWLNLLNNLALSVWWCDSGSLLSNSKRVILRTDNYSQSDIHIICKYFNNVLKLDTKEYITGKNKIRISISPVNKFLKFIDCSIPHNIINSISLDNVIT